MKYRQILLFNVISIIGLSLLFNRSINAQEVLIQLDGNPIVQQHYKQQKNFKAANSVDTLELPFFDDFSNSNIYPNPNLWSDKNAYINGTYAIDPPSIGVATLDAVDSKGDFYEKAGYNNFFSADELTSNPINLDYPEDKNIYLSFFYQPQGLGDNPEVGDSLFLEFYDPIDSVWNRVWEVEGSALAAFKQEIIQVWPEKYLRKGFQFRFRNIASLSGDIQPSKAVNADHWNIDYVYLNNGRTAADTIYHDIAFIYPMSSVLKNYESMPWKHYLHNKNSELGTTVSCLLRNNDNVTRIFNPIYFVFHDNSGNEINDTLSAGGDNLPSGKDTLFVLPFYPYTFITNTSDSASFNIEAHFVTDGFDRAENNNVIYTQKFYDYYSYDDGTAEAGYGLIGEGTQNALLAYKFDCKKQDTLKAIQMYFAKSYNNKSEKYFYLTIWDDNEGKPGQIIYQRQGYKPEYESDLNKFHTYYINDTTLVLNRVFYVGWQQTTSDLLNIGFDFNRNSKNNIFYNINGSWQKSKFEGALMIRTFFGKNLTTDIVPIIKKTKVQVKIFPNPAKENITIQIDNPSDYKQLTVSIYNLSGSLVHQSIQNNNTPINLSDFNEGVYIIRLTDIKKSINYSCKLIKTN